jgi:Rieske Fe-S protein
VFHPETGGVLAGPPPRPLPRIELSEANGILYAVQETPG